MAKWLLILVLPLGLAGCVTEQGAMLPMTLRPERHRPGRLPDLWRHPRLWLQRPRHAVTISPTQIGLSPEGAATWWRQHRVFGGLHRADL